MVVWGRRCAVLGEIFSFILYRITWYSKYLKWVIFSMYHFWKSGKMWKVWFLSAHRFILLFLFFRFSRSCGSIVRYTCIVVKMNYKALNLTFGSAPWVGSMLSNARAFRNNWRQFFSLSYKIFINKTKEIEVLKVVKQCSSLGHFQ